MRFIVASVFVAFLAQAAPADGQSFGLHASAGPTIRDAGYSVAAGATFAPASRVTLGFNVERTHLNSETTVHEGGVISKFRGGTLTVGSGEIQFVPLGRHRVGPYALAGFAAGRSRPNVNEDFPDPVTNDVRAIFFGGGVLVPVGERLHLFADSRMMVGAEGIEGIVAVATLRAGLAWTF